ncbi:MAG: ABC transporter ATP-binding protein, partial [Amnibacterium sp.]
MTTTTATSTRRFGRPRAEAGPRARFADLLPYLREHRGVLGAVIGISVLGALASLAQPLLLQQVVQRVQRSQPLGDVIVVMAVVVAFAAITNGIQHYLLQRTGTSVVLSARQRLIRHLLRLPVAEFDRRRTGDLVSRIGTDTTLLYAVLTQGLVDAAGGAVTFVGALIGMLVFDPVLLGLTVLIILFAILVVGGLARRIRTASRRQQDAVGRLTAEVERSIGAVRTIRASGATERETEAVVGVAKQAWTAGLGVASASAPVVPVASLTLNLAFLVVIGVGGFQVAAGTTTIASLSAFLFFLFLLVMPLGQAFGAASSVASALGALGRITEVLDLPTETAADPADAGLAGPANAAAAPTAPAIEFEHVSFAYRGEDGTRIDVLHDVSFAVPRGTRTALVGPSGAGKSTRLALLERLYDVDGGAVRVGGVDIRRLPREVLRS